MPRELSPNSRIYLLAYKVDAQMRLFGRRSTPAEMARLLPRVARIYADEYLPGARGQALRPIGAGPQNDGETE